MRYSGTNLGEFDMKQKRQDKIKDIVKKYDIETQDELLEKLAKEGINATQATISRDIREINLTKTSVGGGRQKYTLGKDSEKSSIETYRKVLSAGIISLAEAENLVVIKTVSGMAMAVAAALDNVEIPGMLGSIAGDDTIFLAVKSRDMTGDVIQAIERLQIK
jgi:transcriptional regulator of arginine metabolism